MRALPPPRRVVQVLLLIAGWLAIFVGCLVGVARGHWILILATIPLMGLAVWLVDAFAPGISPHAMRRGQRARLGPPRVALTFDDGPSEDTPAVLAALAQTGVRATFFMLGRHVEQHPEIARAVVNGGHAIGNHTYSHRILSFCRATTVAKEIDRTKELLESIGARRVQSLAWWLGCRAGLTPVSTSRRRAADMPSSRSSETTSLSPPISWIVSPARIPSRGVVSPVTTKRQSCITSSV